LFLDQSCAEDSNWRMCPGIYASDLIRSRVAN
jgi:hypothetical protein